MSKDSSERSLWDIALDWMDEVHGKKLTDDKKGTLNILLNHLDVFIDEIASVLEENFVPLDIQTVEEAGLEPLMVPNKLFPLLGSSYILQSEANEGLKSILKPTVIKTEIDDFSDDEEMNDYSEDEELNDYSDEEDVLSTEAASDPSVGDEVDEGAYTCNKCSSIYETYDALADHLQSQCVKKFKSPKKGRKSKYSIEDRTCKTCSKTFSSVKYLKYYHSLRCFGSPTSDPLKHYLLKCSNCYKVYKTVPHYYLHIKTCGDKESSFERVDSRELKDMSCRKCGFIAASKDEYQKANHTCEPNKRYKCLKCDFKTCHPGSLRNHDLAIHNKDKAVYCCEICGASFSYKTGFNRHLKTHLEKPSKVPCNHCDMHFSGRSSLMRHMKRHHKPTQEHPCEICGKTYLTYRYLTRHIRSQHPESGQLEKHECIHCHSFFREKAYLRKHIRKKHGSPL